MKKRMTATLLATVVALSTGTALAADEPVQLEGSAQVQYRKDTKTGEEDQSGTITTVTLNAKAKLQENLNVFARFGFQALSNKDFDDAKDFSDASKSSVGAIDQYGLQYENAGFQYKLGRQDATVGSTALLYNNAGNIGKHAFADGLSISGKTGVTTLKAYAVREDNFDASNGRLYALEASYSPAEKWTVGTALARYTNDGLKTNHWAVNTGYEIGKFAFSGEFAKSNAADNNKAFDIGVTYNLNDKHSFSITNFKVEENGDIAGNTDFDNGEKGFYYSYNYQLTNNTALSLWYKDAKVVGDSGTKTSSFRTTLSYSF